MLIYCYLFVKSGPIFVPMKSGEENGNLQSASNTEDIEEGSSKSVRFNGVVEVCTPSNLILT